MNQQIDTPQARAVAVNPAAVMAAAFDIDVEPGRVVRAALDRRDTHATGAQAWVGHVLNDPLSTVTLAWVGGVVQGSLRVAEAGYSIEPTGAAGVQVMRQVNLFAARPEFPPLVPTGPLAPAADTPSVASDNGSTIDVIVFYTAAAAGGANSRIALGISETNTAFGNSGIIPRLRLVRTQQANYA